MLKIHKLEKWGKGLQKGLTQYVGETYDQERDAMEQQAIKEKRVGSTSIVTEMNKNIYLLDMDESDLVNQRIDEEAYDMNGIPDDDDYGDNDGDEEF